ncbi:carbohydrate ABC transporter permease [Paenibacillus sp. NRS-1781]|uniref:carbohydrate ABC transporter permease n=1 Tax=unclassified Paenibacillus TaxID=185978 RepID=UPI003D286BD8
MQSIKNAPDSQFGVQTGKVSSIIEWLKRHPYMWFIAPGFILYSMFVIYPIVSAAIMSLYYSNGFGDSKFVGFQNYIELFTTKELYSQFLNAFKNNVFLFVLNTVLVLPAQLYLAYLIHTKIRGYRFFQTMIFAPQFITSTVVIFMGTLIFDQNIGMFNHILTLVGLESWVQNWLGIPGKEMYVIFLISTWSGIGFSMIYFIGAMKMLPEEIFEAAFLDGAGYWGRFFHIVIPLLRTSIINVVIISYIFSMTVFDYNYMLGGVSGGTDHSMDVMTLFFYRVAFGSNGAMGGTVSANSIGMGTTIACVMFVVILIVALVQLKLLSGKEEN